MFLLLKMSLPIYVSLSIIMSPVLLDITLWCPPVSVSGTASRPFLTPHSAFSALSRARAHTMEASTLTVTPLYGAHSADPPCYLLEIDDFTILLDAGWTEAFDVALLESLRTVNRRLTDELKGAQEELNAARETNDEQAKRAAESMALAQEAVSSSASSSAKRCVRSATSHG